jgi:hypothetical protein
LLFDFNFIVVIAAFIENGKQKANGVCLCLQSVLVVCGFCANDWTTLFVKDKRHKGATKLSIYSMLLMKVMAQTTVVGRLE